MVRLRRRRRTTRCCRRCTAQADALVIEAQAKRRLADEYDAAQERGEVASKGGNYGNQHAAYVVDENVATAADLGLNRNAIYDARVIRDAEANDPGIVARTVAAAVERGEAPTRQPPCCQQ